MNGNFNLKSGNQDQANYNGSFGGNYDVNYKTSLFTWRLGVLADFDIYRGPNETDEQSESYGAYLNTNVDRYLGETDFFNYGSLDIGYRKLMAAEDADDPYVKLGVGAGYGRVINATVMAKAMRIVDELIKYNVISRKLSSDAYVELAQIIDKEPEYRATHGAIEYKKFWYEDMEQVFVNEGVLPEGSLQALGIVRLQEVLEQRFSIRKHGWMIRAGLGFIISNYDGSEQDPSLDVSFEIAHPFSYKLQLIERLDYSTILEDDISHHITNRLSISYEISNEVNWENSLITSMFIPSDEERNNIISNTLASTFYYYLTNQLNLNATLRFHLLDDGTGYNDELETTFYLGASYRLR